MSVDLVGKSKKKFKDRNLFRTGGSGKWQNLEKDERIENVQSDKKLNRSYCYVWAISSVPS
jgi:CRISPR/Cas system CMR-associated protein Cmr3 (group 5 of RAMP superfamily)